MEELQEQHGPTKLQNEPEENVPDQIEDEMYNTSPRSPHNDAGTSTDRDRTFTRQRETSAAQPEYTYNLRKNPKKKRNSSWIYPLDVLKAKTEKCTSNATLTVQNLPDHILRDILEEVVLEDGDVAYWRLSLVCRRWCEIVTAEEFQKDCHMQWLYSLRPRSYWEEPGRRQYAKPFKLLICPACGDKYKHEGPGYWGGHGKRGEFIGWYAEENEHIGYCSKFCFMLHTSTWDQEND